MVSCIKPYKTSIKDEMFPYAVNILNKSYQDYVILARGVLHNTPYKPDFILQKVEGNTVKQIFVEILPINLVLMGHVKKLRDYAENVKEKSDDQYHYEIKKLIIVPCNTQLGVGIHNDIQVKRFKGFICDGSNVRKKG